MLHRKIAKVLLHRSLILAACDKFLQELSKRENCFSPLRTTTEVSVQCEG